MTLRRVANTRPRDQADELSALLREAGFEPVETPALDVTPAWSGTEMAATLSRLRAGGYAACVVPSRNAAVFFVDGISTAGGGGADLAATRVISGAATARALGTLGVSVADVLDRFSARAMLDMLSDQLTAGTRVLIPHAAEGRDELIEGLRRAGIAVDAPVCYQTQAVAPASLRPIADSLLASELAAVTFASPSAVRSVVRGLRALGQDPVELLASVALVCIGDTTAAAVRDEGLRVAAVANATTSAALVAAVESAITPVAAGA